jgi:alcohol dehydrogenase (NADP+)
MSATRGYAALRVKEALGPFTFERRELRDHDVAIEIKYCGICHSDIHQARDEWGGAIFPMVPGHEITGVVTAAGRGASKYKVGDKVGVGVLVDSCRTCVECKSGLEPYCTVQGVFTYNSRDKEGAPTHGGYSEKIVVDENYVYRIPENLPLDAAAPLLCAGITVYSPLRHWEAGPGKRVAIVGLGGLGHMGVKFSHALGAETTVLSQSLKKQADGRRLGADQFYATADPDTFVRLKGYFDLIINTVSSEMDWNQYLQLLRMDGSMVVVGIPEKQVPIGATDLIRGRRSLAGSMVGGIAETQGMLDFCGKHNIVADIEGVPIQKVNEAFERVLRSDVRYRFVIDMASLKNA